MRELNRIEWMLCEETPQTAAPTVVHNIIVGKLWIDQHSSMSLTNHTTRDVGVLNFIPYSQVANLHFFAFPFQRSQSFWHNPLSNRYHFGTTLAAVAGILTQPSQRYVCVSPPMSESV
jgi:hypothetical protein